MKKDLKAESAFLQNTPVLLEKMACAERFRKCTVGGFVNEILSRQAQQFAAVTIGLDDGTTYISFRGTDDTIVGWKEDFNLSNGVVPSHRKALEYLEYTWNLYAVHAADRRAFQRRKSGYVCSDAV